MRDGGGSGVGLTRTTGGIAVDEGGGSGAALTRTTGGCDGTGGGADTHSGAGVPSASGSRPAWPG